MFVNEVNKSKGVSSSGKVKKTANGENFSSYLLDIQNAKDASVVAKSSGIGVNDAIFSTQMINDEEEKEKKKQLVKRANSLIEKLEVIRHALLDGFISRDKLIEISRFVKERKIQTSDAYLQDLIEQIELRVEVELAKIMK